MESFITQCSSQFSAELPILLALLLGGMAAGFTHCVPMCGTIIACGRACSNNSSNISVNYHLGRVLTYSSIGFVGGYFSKAISSFAFWPKIEGAMLMLAGVLFLYSAASGLLIQKNHNKCGKTANTFFKGLAMGFLPCGMIYSALMLAASTASPVMGGAGMALFALGTIPALSLIELGVKFIPARYGAFFREVGRVVMAANGIWLLRIAGKLMI